MSAPDGTSTCAFEWTLDEYGYITPPQALPKPNDGYRARLEPDPDQPGAPAPLPPLESWHLLDSTTAFR
jgi:hypothetical protein